MNSLEFKNEVIRLHTDSYYYLTDIDYLKKNYKEKYIYKYIYKEKVIRKNPPIGGFWATKLPVILQKSFSFQFDVDSKPCKE